MNLQSQKTEETVLNRKISCHISLGICIFFSVLLVVWLFTFPAFFDWFYVTYHHLNALNPTVKAAIRTVVPTFYTCAPFAAIALFFLIRMLLNIMKDKTFVAQNVFGLRAVSWCCYAVTLATFIAGLKYMPLFIVAASSGIVGTLLRVVKNLMQSAMELKEENELTI